MTTELTITTQTPPANRNELAQAFGPNQSAVRRLEAMTRDITITLPDAIDSVYALIQTLQQAAYVLAAPNANLPNADVLKNGAGLSLTLGAGTITLALQIPVTVPNGGTGQTVLPANGVVIGNGASPVASAAPGAAGTALVSNGPTSNPSFQSVVSDIAAGTGINVSSSTGSVTISLQVPVAIANGGTNGTTASSALANLGGVPLSSVGAANGVASLDVSGKVPLAQLPASVVGSLNYQGTWNASTNTPTLVSGTGTKGFFYKVSVAGSTTIDGNSQWNVGDIIAFDGVVWDKIDGIPSEVTSVNGQVGAATITAAGIGAAATVNNLSDLASASAARGNLGLGTAAVQNVTYFLQAANNLSDLASASTARSNLGLGSIATQAASAVAITGGAVQATTGLGAGGNSTPAGSATGIQFGYSSTGAYTWMQSYSAPIVMNPLANHILMGTTTDDNSGNKLQVSGGLSISSATMMQTNTAFTNGAASSTGTLTNAPAAGNPTKWIPINDNGTVRHIPAW